MLVLPNCAKNYASTIDKSLTATTRRSAKNNMFILLQTKTLHVRHAILYISLPSLHHYNMKLPNFTSPLYGVSEHNTKIVAFIF